MRHLARTAEVQSAPRAPAPAAPEILDLGGPVAAMHRSLADRLAASPVGLRPVAPEGVMERGLKLASRCAGPVALGLGYVVAARLLFG